LCIKGKDLSSLGIQEQGGVPILKCNPTCIHFKDEEILKQMQKEKKILRGLLTACSTTLSEKSIYIFHIYTKGKRVIEEGVTCPQLRVSIRLPKFQIIFLSV